MRWRGIMRESPNFQFLKVHDPQLVRLASLAEGSLHVDPPTTILKVRQFVEVLARHVAAKQGALGVSGETFSDLLRRLQETGRLPREAAEVFHHLRRLGNAAAHENRGSALQALSSLKLARELGIWFHRTFRPERGFSPGPFAPPPLPHDPSVELRAEVEMLRAKLLASEDAAARVARGAEELRRANETADERLARERQERALWEQLAEEAERRKVQVEAELRAIQAANANPAPSAVATAIATAAETAGRIIVDEADTRIMIDAQLSAAGWEADSTTLRHARGTRPARGRAMAIAEWPTESGSVDYALFLDGRGVGVVEAKRSGLAVPAALDQARRYARTIRLEPDEAAFGTPYAHGLDEAYRVPFVFATNGRPYLKQLETQSGIWNWDARRATNRAVALPEWFTPRDLAERLEQELDATGLSEDLPDLPACAPTRPPPSRRSRKPWRRAGGRSWSPWRPAPARRSPASP